MNFTSLASYEQSIKILNILDMLDMYDNLMIFLFTVHCILLSMVFIKTSIWDFVKTILIIILVWIVTVIAIKNNAQPDKIDALMLVANVLVGMVINIGLVIYLKMHQIEIDKLLGLDMLRNNLKNEFKEKLKINKDK